MLSIIGKYHQKLQTNYFVYFKRCIYYEVTLIFSLRPMTILGESLCFYFLPSFYFSTESLLLEQQCFVIRMLFSCLSYYKENYLWVSRVCFIIFIAMSTITATVLELEFEFIKSLLNKIIFLFIYIVSSRLLFLMKISSLLVVKSCWYGVAIFLGYLFIFHIFNQYHITYKINIFELTGI